jgi:hypothetical protein
MRRNQAPSKLYTRANSLLNATCGIVKNTSHFAFIMYQAAFYIGFLKHLSAQQQGCQMFPGATYQNGKNIPNGHKIFQMAIHYANIIHSQKFRNWDFWY